MGFFLLAGWRGLIFYKTNIELKNENLQIVPVSFCEKFSIKFRAIDDKTGVLSQNELARATTRCFCCSKKEESSVTPG